MDINFGQALLIAIWSGFIISGPIFTPLMGMFKPMFSGLVIGLVLGDVKLGLIAGGTFDLAYLGFGRAGGANPPSNAAPAIFGVIWVVALGMDIQVALALTFPIAVFIAFMNTFVFSIMSPVSKIVETTIKSKRKISYYLLANSTLMVLFTAGIIIGFVSCYSIEGVNSAIQNLPKWLMDVFKVSGNLLPGLGFAIILSIMMKKSYIPFALLGYFGTSYLGLGSIPLVILGVIVAATILLVEKNCRNYIDEKMKDASLSNMNGGMANGI